MLFMMATMGRGEHLRWSLVIVVTRRRKEERKKERKEEEKGNEPGEQCDYIKVVCR